MYILELLARLTKKGEHVGDVRVICNFVVLTRRRFLNEYYYALAPRKQSIHKLEAHT